MAGQLTKAKIGKEDLELQEDTGAATTFERTSSVGATVNITKIPDIWGYTGAVRSGDIVTKGPWIDVRAHGAVNGSDITEAIDAAVSAAPADGATIYIPPGEWGVSGQTTISKDGILIKGEGPRHGKAGTGLRQGSYIIPKGNITGSIFKFTYATGTTATRGCGIQDISFLDDYGSGPAQGGRQYTMDAAVHIHASDQFYMNRVDFTNLKGRAIYTQRCVKSKFSNIDIFWTGNTSKPAMDLNEIDASNYTCACEFINFSVDSCFLDDYIAISSNSQGNLFTNFVFEAYHTETDTEQIFIDCDSNRNIFTAIKMNENQGSVNRFHVDGTANIIQGLMALGSSPAGYVIKFAGHYNVLAGFHIEAGAQASQQSIHVTNAAYNTTIGPGTILNMGGITIDSGCYNTLINGVSYYNSGGTPISDSGTNTVIGTCYGTDETVTAASPTLQHWGYSRFNTTSNAIAATLPDGKYVGQQKTMVMTTRPGSNNAVVTVSHHAAGDSGTYTFDDVDEAVILGWTGTEWIEVVNQDATWAGP